MRNARERSEQMRMLANARNELEDAGGEPNHARRKGGVANFDKTPNYEFSKWRGRDSLAFEAAAVSAARVLKGEDGMTGTDGN